MSRHDLEPRPANPEAPDDWVTRAQAIVRRVVYWRLGRACPDADDVCAQALMQLAQRLDGEPRGGLQSSIEGFVSYASAVTNHACDHYLRAKHPLRWRLRNRLRYALEHDRRFLLWKEGDGTWLCGRPAWRGRPRVQPPLQEELAPGDERQPGELLQRMFDLSSGPLELAAVVDLAASLWGVPLRPWESIETAEAVPDPRAGIDVALDHRRAAEQLWAHVQALPDRQRLAVLFNLRHDMMRMLVVTGLTSFSALAAMVGLSADSFAALWNDLPLSDNQIADRLGCTRQQVINLRMAARKRLANRLVR